MAVTHQVVTKRLINCLDIDELRQAIGEIEMPDITAISSAVTTIKTAFDIARYLKESDLSLKEAEAKLKLAELVSALADANLQISEVKELLIEKDQKIKELEQCQEIKGKLEYEKPYYWLVDGKQKDGPYCQHCRDNDKKMIRLQGNGEGYWNCTACKNGYKDGSYKPHSPSVVIRKSRWDGLP
ncbi:hypothetical protein [Candidatus Thiosymbion oneisti]|uniref:hypothetical protein n=1 Tax=Candidatus Thiosymbion oneisti TaxID=589554 RepID=UPI000B7ED253|nr:hypothetical protein [Candidatus Thiosymbion oneisti]